MMRWLIVALCVVLVVLLLAYARGERQRGQDVPEASAIVLVA
jgi:hypothetical protein